MLKSVRFGFVALCVGVALMLGGCTAEPENGAEGLGVVRLGVEFDSSTTRAEVNPQINSIEVANGVGMIRSWKSLDEIPAELVLTSGTYTVTVSAGVAATGFDGPHYSGNREFTVSAGSEESVEVVCTIDNVLVGVSFDQTVTDNLTDYSVRVSADAANSVTFTAENCERVAYITPAAGDTDMTWNFAAQTAEGTAVSAEGKITNLKPATEYRLAVKYNIRPLGGAVINVVLNEDTDDVEDVFDIYGRPEIKALDFEISEPQQPRPEPFTIRAKAPSTIISLTASSVIYGEEPVQLLGWSGGAGVVVTQVSDTECTVALGEEYIASLPGGVTDIVFTVLDDKGNTAGATASFLKAGVSAVSDWDMWATRTSVSAVMPKVENSVQFGYMVAQATRSGEWTMVDAVYDETSESYRADLSGLTPSTTYSVCLFVGGAATGEPVTITTEAAPQILNGDFESWHKSGKIWYPYASGATPYWDSGNKGATTLGDSWNLTLSSEDPRPGSSGKLCVRMQSAFPSMMGIGKFAAGNVYTGRFAELDGMNGVVEFGQPFTGRPTALHGWFKCNVGQINKTGDGAPVTSGPDRYQIMICLTTDKHSVNTADKSTFFDCKTHSKVVAWAEILGTESVKDWTEFTIPLNYVKPGVRPSYIIIVASASSYGDYFTGSTDSWMCVDDFELIY